MNTIALRQVEEIGMDAEIYTKVFQDKLLVGGSDNWDYMGTFLPGARKLLGEFDALITPHLDELALTAWAARVSICVGLMNAIGELIRNRKNSDLYRITTAMGLVEATLKGVEKVLLINGIERVVV